MAKSRKILALFVSAGLITTAVFAAFAAEPQTEENNALPASAQSSVMTEEEISETAEASSQGASAEKIVAARLDVFGPWLSMKAARELALQEKELELSSALSQAALEKEQALLDAAQTAESEKTQALSEAAASAESEMEKALSDAAATAQSEMEKALGDAAASAESEMEKALSDAAASAESEKEKALSDVVAAAEAEKEKALALAAETASSEKEAALSEAAETASSEKEQALSDAAAAAQAEKEQALSDAAAEAQAEKEQALLDAAATAQSEKEQALSDAKDQWESEQEAKEQAESEAVYNSNVWTKGVTAIRESEDPESKVLVYAPADSPVRVLAGADGSYLVNYYGLQGYVAEADVTVPEPMEESVQSAPELQKWCSVNLESAASHLNVRDGAGTDAAIIDRLNSNEIVYMTGNLSEDGKWAEIVYNNGGGTGWSSTDYLVPRSEGEPDELTRLMYYGEYEKVEDIVLDTVGNDEVKAWQNGNEVDPETVTGTATILSNGVAYVGEVELGIPKGRGTVFTVTGAKETGYTAVTSDWNGDEYSGVTVLTYGNSADPTLNYTLTGNVTEGDGLNGDVTILAAMDDGSQKYFYGFAEHDVIVSSGTDEEGREAIAKSADGKCFYLSDVLMDNVQA